MQKVSSISSPVLIKMLMGKTVHMTSDCEFFPNFNIQGKVIEYRMHNNELIFKIKVNNKLIDVGCNMKNLQFELI